MARQARGEYLDPNEIQIVHAVNRCVRRAFLCGEDPYSGKSYEHRRQWIRDRLEFLASVFAIDCLTFAVMSNHLHLILRSRPDIAETWTDEEVARRWLTLCPHRRDKQGNAAQPTAEELRMVTTDVDKVNELRGRLSDISWWMAKTAEKIARMSNREDKCTGRFWEGRYKAQLLLDEASLLACAMYVDLNPIRAAMAESPEESDFTGAKARIDDLKDRFAKSPRRSQQDLAPKAQRCRTRKWERSRRRTQSGWMSPLEISEASDAMGPNQSACGRRASLKGFLSMSLGRYLELLDWTGRQLKSKKRGKIPDDFAPILTRLGIQANAWCKLVSGFGKLFKRAAGRSDSMAIETARRRQSWMQSPGAAYLN